MRLHPEDIKAISQQVIDGLLAASKERKARKSRKAKVETYTPEFEQCWSKYPNRPNNNKQKAFRAFSQWINKGVEPAYLYDKTVEYYKFCEATDKLGKEIVLMASTFYGPDKRFDDERDIPAEALTPEWAKLPTTNEDLWNFAKKHGFSNPGSLQFPAYRQKLQSEVEKKIASLNRNGAGQYSER